MGDTTFADVVFPLISILLIVSIIIAFSIYFVIALRKNKKKYDDIIDENEKVKSLLGNIDTKYSSLSTGFNSNLNTLSNNVINFKGSLTSNMYDINTRLENQIDTSKINIDNKMTIGSSNNNIIFSSTDPLNFDHMYSKDMFFTDYLKVGTFTVRDSNGNMNFSSSSGNNKIIMNDVNSSNIKTSTVNIGGKLNFTDLKNPTTFDVSPEGDLRLIMQHGSNGISQLRSFDIVDGYGEKHHEFDIYGNARSRNITIDGECINFKNSNNSICYKGGQGIKITSDNPNDVLDINNTLQTNTLNTRAINLGGLILTSSNGILSVYQDNKMLGNVSYVNS